MSEVLLLLQRKNRRYIRESYSMVEKKSASIRSTCAGLHSETSISRFLRESAGANTCALGLAISPDGPSRWDSFLDSQSAQDKSMLFMRRLYFASQ